MSENNYNPATDLFLKTFGVPSSVVETRMDMLHYDSTVQCPLADRRALDSQWSHVGLDGKKYASKALLCKAYGISVRTYNQRRLAGMSHRQALTYVSDRQPYVSVIGFQKCKKAFIMLDGTIYYDCTCDICGKQDILTQEEMLSHFGRHSKEQQNTWISKSHSRVGETQKMSCGLEATIIAYRSANDIDVMFSNGVIVNNKKYRQFIKGSIKLPGIHRVGEININNQFI